MWVEIIVQLWAVLGFAVVCVLIKDWVLSSVDIALVAFVSAEFVSATAALPLPALFVCATSQSGVLPAVLWYAQHYNSKHAHFWFRVCAGIVIVEGVLFAVYAQYTAAIASLLLSFFFFRITLKLEPNNKKQPTPTNTPETLSGFNF
jgi:hypothetical protein